MIKIIYPIVHAFFYVLSLLPFWALYGISNGLYYLVYYVIRYRRRMVRQNITSSFPEKDEKEIKSIEKGFYRFLCDYFMETIKLLSVSEKTFLKHIEFRGVEGIEQCFDKGQHCALLAGHYCNWEYLTTMKLPFKRHKDFVMGVIYHPLSSKVFDRLFIDIRQHFYGTCVPKQDILRQLLTLRRENRMSLFGYAGDQSPKWTNIHLWLPFLNHDTPVFTGGERIMRKMNNAVFYVDMERPRRGYYVVNLKQIPTPWDEMEEFALTREFFKMLEETVRREPRYYLWSHNRWKRTHEEFDRRYEVVNGKVRAKKIEN